MKDGRPRDAGFTLLEVLAALVVLGFLVAGLSTCVQLALRTWRQQDREVAARGDLDAADRALRRLIAGIEPGTVTRATLVIGGPDRLAITAALPAQAPTARADIVIGLARRRLVLRWTPQATGISLEPSPPVQEIELLQGVSGVRFAYWPRPGTAGLAGEVWRDSWTEAVPPALIRVRLSFQDGRHWPDIIAAPMREQPGAR